MAGLRSKMNPESFSVLLIDDDETTANLFKMILEHHQLPLMVVREAASALEYLKTNTPDVIVIDIFLPGMDGYQTLAAIRKNGLAQGINCIATTSYYTTDTKTEALNRGFDGYITKPLEMSKLVPYLKQVVQKP
jgi:CheY-like chemotaxis protein